MNDIVKKQQPDWPPRSSAFNWPEGTRRHGSTGQLWEVKDGIWVRVDPGLGEADTEAKPRAEFEEALSQHQV
jgi:hypothetical protein